MSDYLQCPQCGMKYHHKAERCPKCKKSPEEIVEHQKKVQEAAEKLKQNQQKKPAVEQPKTTKTCPVCAMDVPIKAKLCPYCNKGKWNNSTSGCLTFLIIFIVFIAFVTSQGNKSTDKKRTDSESQTSSSSREVVSNSPWDGSVRQVESWLKNNLKDPDSLKVASWGKVIKVDTPEVPHTYFVWCEYRAKNSFGGYIAEKRRFYLDAKGNVIKTLGPGE